MTVTSRFMFPNIFQIFHLLMIIPVTSAGVMQTNSAMKLVKTVIRSTMQQDRLNALMLLLTHSDIKLDYDTILDMYSRKYPRKMLFLNRSGDR